MDTSSSPSGKPSRLPQLPESLWRATTELPSFPSLRGTVRADVAIVGGGIAGITSAYLLTKQGFKVVLLEAGLLLDGTTGHTTAKITAQHGAIYGKLLKHLDREQAKQYFDANDEALKWIVRTVAELGIECGLKTEDAYLYADNEADLETLRQEWKAYGQIGLPGEWVDKLPLEGLAELGAIKLPGQARFHPLQYLQALLQEALKQGLVVHEYTTVTDKVEEGKQDGRLKLRTAAGGTVDCSWALSASHFPFTDGGGLYFSRLHAQRSYVLAVEAEKPFPGGMYLSVGQTVRSLRAAELDGRPVVLVGGENHKTGQGPPMIEHYEALERYADSLLGVRSIAYRWSAQDLTTLDEMPYIGPIRDKHPNLLIATGFNKWGMTTGTLAALTFEEMVRTGQSLHLELFKPSRFHADPSIKTFVRENLNVAGQLLAGKLDSPMESPDALAAGQGGVVKVAGKRAGGYREPGGALHLVDTTCTHMGCECKWNAGDLSWDCPCHGSRFGYDGTVLEGPAIEPLKRLELPRAEG
ncbi:Rieske [2Fe-2S] iron-sulfur protein [Paenibacillus pasadenensis]|uniref:Rieske [2Fe-2S] iron-sulfur protein n=1 Tax=Paenibacillus pasadenensis TaxID=217090 RepID=A0A2N5NDP0_9BACL|nr:MULTISPECIES: FAD-dependent oxidoreductase [Paenibacillus]PLT48467.1 Rieske [2Fe-2S] iron-sulfur protein [Paenibacillus pasadenensis]QGG58052.1 FAD-dependent oxidoreductase [Paenibacillus sp. B01]